MGDRFLRYGKPGTKLRGSSLYRWYCSECGEPIRIGGELLEELAKKPQKVLCSRCDHQPPGHFSGPMPKSGEEAGPWQENAIRCLEEG